LNAIFVFKRTIDTNPVRIVEISLKTITINIGI